ncbi:MAG: alpha/beta hydrolase [Acidobacteria bacterium]|nr:alpha/beta hydrolase [Acidobacteriota bacterium]
MQRTVLAAWLIIGAVVAAPQLGAAQDGPTTGADMMQPFDPSYLTGVWEVEWVPPDDLGLFPPGPLTGMERVTHIDNRFLKVEVHLQGRDGTDITGEGMIFYEYGLGGQSLVRYVVYDAGFALLQQGPVGGDLGGYYSAFWETPEIEHNATTYSLRGRSYFVSPDAYRVNQEISVDREAFANLGIMWLTRKPCVSAPAVTVTDWRGESVVATEGAVDSNGVRIVYHTAGEGPLVIFVHGVSSPWHDYRHQIPMLAEKYRVVAMSTRGTDMSDKPEGYENYFAEHISNDISAIIEHFGEDKATIVGQDSGGLYAWHFAMTRPDQTERLISIGTVHPGGLTRELIDNPAQQQANQFQRNMQVFPEAGNDFGQGVRAAPRDPDEPADLAQLRREAAACLDTDSVVGFYKTNWPTSPTTMETESVGFKIGEFPPVKAPTLFIYGKDGPFFLNPSVNGMWEWVEGPLTIQVLPGVGHGPHKEAPEFVTPRIMEWLETGR